MLPARPSAIRADTIQPTGVRCLVSDQAALAQGEVAADAVFALNRRVGWEPSYAKCQKAVDAPLEPQQRRDVAPQNGVLLAAWD